MIIINGELDSHNKIILDEGFIFGRAIFETILVKKDALFLKEHIERINSSAKTLGINNSLTEEYILTLIKKYTISNCALKIILSPENIVLTTRDIPYNTSHYEKGFSLNVSNILKNETSSLPFHKWTGYLENIFIREEAVKKGFNDSILINTKGFISETSTANIFFIKNNTIHTPNINSGILNGIIRNWIISNYKVIEGNFTLDDLITSDGVFITNSLVGIIKIKKINTSTISDNNLILQLSKDYSNIK